MIIIIIKVLKSAKTKDPVLWELYNKGNNECGYQNTGIIERPFIEVTVRFFLLLIWLL